MNFQIIQGAKSAGIIIPMNDWDVIKTNYFNIKKQVLSVIFLLAIGLTSINAQEALIASGGNASGSGGTASYSIGQVVYTNNTGAGGLVSQGVQQPYEIFIVSGVEEQGINLSYIVYPNPTTENVVLSIDASSSVETQSFASLQYILSDINGKRISQQSITGNRTIIPIEQFPVGTYFVTIIEKTQPTQLKTFKIIKK